MNEVKEMNDTFWGLYETQIAALRNHSSSKEANTIAMETAKLLMENIDVSDAVLTHYDKMEMRKLFAGYNTLGTAVTDFYESNVKYLDSSAISGAIGQKMAKIKNQIEEKAEMLREIQESERELLEKEDELEALEREWTCWQEKVNNLRVLDENAKAEIEKNKELFQRLDKSIKEHEEEMLFWEAHLGENSEILSKMQEYGVTSLSDVIKYVAQLKANIVKNLDELDAVIKKIVEQEKLLRDEVMRRQNKMV